VSDAAREPGREEYERGFRRAGLPLFIEDYTATDDIFTRAVPVLAAVFIFQVIGAINLDWSLAANLAAVAGGLVILLSAIGLLNRSRSRPFWSIPERIGRLELAGFVLIPAILPLVFGGHWDEAIETVIGNLLFLGLVYLVVGYGVVSILRWVGRRLLRQMATASLLLARAVPLLLIIVLLAFINLEMWQVFAGVPVAGLVMIGGLFVGLGTSFLFARLPREVQRLEQEAGSGSPPLDPRQRRNVALVLFISQAMQVLFVSLVVAAFFVVFGAIAITEPVRDAWIQGPENVLVTIDLPGQTVELTEELLRVACGLAAFSGLYFAIAMLTDSTYRAEFLDELTGEMRASFRDRAAYLRLIAATSRD
jgi:hypothetical protein